MKKRMIAAVTLAALLFSLCACGGKKETVVVESGKTKYRSLFVLSNVGKTEVERKEVTDRFYAYEGMNLVNGDSLSVEDESSLVIKTDKKRYLQAEEGAKFTLEATGSGDETKTIINVTEGEVLAYIDKKLKENETYEVHTPNAVMSVRGTVFRVSVVPDVDGLSISSVEVMDGSVQVNLLQDGEKSDEKLVVKAGYLADVFSSEDEGSYFMTEEPIEIADYEEKKEEIDAEAQGWEEISVTPEPTGTPSEKVNPVTDDPQDTVMPEPTEIPEITDSPEDEYVNPSRAKSRIPENMEGLYYGHFRLYQNDEYENYPVRAYLQNTENGIALVFCSKDFYGRVTSSEMENVETDRDYYSSGKNVRFGAVDYEDLNINITIENLESNYISLRITYSGRVLSEHQLLFLQQRTVDTPELPYNMEGEYENTEESAYLTIYKDEDGLLCAEMNTESYSGIIKGLLPTAGKESKTAEK